MKYKYLNTRYVFITDIRNWNYETFITQHSPSYTALTLTAKNVMIFP